jgi:paraquat-inducible protein A
MAADAHSAHDLIACHECDFVQRHIEVAPGATARCFRCNGFLYRHPDKSLDHPVAWSITGLILLVLANVFPVLDLAVAGHETNTTLVSGAVALYRQGQFAVALLVVGVLIVAPALLFLLQAYLLFPLRHNRLVPNFVPLMRLLSKLNHWMMFDVFMLALIVAVVKLSSLASVAPGAGLWAFLALMFASICSLASYDTHGVWDRYSQLMARRQLPAGAAPGRLAPATRVTGETAQSQHSATCSTCGQLCHCPPDAEVSRCPRCGDEVAPRKADSLNRTWALLIAGYVLFIPANLLPITITTSLFGTQPDTIMSGVAYFWHEGAYDLAIIIFTASIFVPLLKLMALTFLTWSAKRRMTWEPQQRTRLYRMVEFVGKWSMLDIFVVAMLARLVQFSSLAAIEAGPGALAFAAVVVVTMFAAMSFDPRLLWDPLEKNTHSGEKRD